MSRYMLEDDPYAFDPEREHNDHVAGMASNEFQTAFQASCAETEIRDDSAEIAEARRDGKWVAVYNAEIRCRHTDAMIGMSTELVGAFDSRDEAIAALGGEEDYFASVLPPCDDALPEQEPVDIDDDDIPF